MTKLMTSTPVVLSLTSLDPSGGGGISADIETLASLGCHCSPIITKLSAHNTGSLKTSQITDTSLLIEQIRAVLEDINVNLFNIGDVASISNAEAIHTILCDYPNIPVLFHPELSEQSDPAFRNALFTLLLPQTNLTILSKDDVLAMAPGADTLSACAQELMEYDCDNLLITRDNNRATQITSHGFSQWACKQQYHFDRLPHSYLGAGNTLAAAISAYLAHGISMAESIQQAQKFTEQALQKGRQIGMGALFPDRLHWCKK